MGIKGGRRETEVLSAIRGIWPRGKRELRDSVQLVSKWWDKISGGHSFERPGAALHSGLETGWQYMEENVRPGPAKEK